MAGGLDFFTAILGFNCKPTLSKVDGHGTRFYAFHVPISWCWISPAGVSFDLSSAREKEICFARSQLMSNRVLIRHGARELTGEEVDQITGASGTSICGLPTTCTPLPKFPGDDTKCSFD
jgi:hypothetical protein